MLKEALSSGVTVLTGFKVKDISGHLIGAEDGRKLSADIIIGADGARSIVRQQLTDDTLNFRWQICFRGIAFGVSDEAWNAAEIYEGDAAHPLQPSLRQGALDKGLFGAAWLFLQWFICRDGVCRYLGAEFLRLSGNSLDSTIRICAAPSLLILR